MDIQFDEYKLDKELGRGSYGIVHLMINNANKKIAAKFINNDEINNLEIKIESLKTEISILQKIKYPAITSFIGSTTSNKRTNNEEHELVIIMEYIDCGSLLATLNDEKTKKKATVKLIPTMKKIIIIGIVCAMKYLHKSGIIHRDLKSENILLDSNFYPHICDFGLSRCFSKSLKKSMELLVTENTGTPLYMAPELFDWDNKNYCSPSIDVYSFGIILYEIMTEYVAYSRNNGMINFYDKIRNGERPLFDDNDKIKPSMKALIEKCWNGDPSQRPSFDDIVDELLNDYQNDYFDGEIINERVDEYISILKKQEIYENSNTEYTQMNKNLQIENECNLKVIKYLLKNSKEKIDTIEILPNKKLINFICENGNVDLVKFLINEMHIKLNPTILHSACESGNFVLFNYLIIDQHMNIRDKNADGNTILHNACLSGNLNFVKSIIKLNVIDINEKNIVGFHILHYACSSNSLDLIKYLFSLKDIEKDPKTKYDQTLLHMACSKGNIDIVKYLIYNQHLKIDVVTDQKKTILHSACESGNIELVDFLLKTDFECPKNFDITTLIEDNNNVLHITCYSGHVYLLKFLLSQKNCPDICSTTDSKMNILHFACESGDIKLVEYILSLKKIDINAKNIDRQTPKDLAKKNKHFKIVELIESKCKKYKKKT